MKLRFLPTTPAAAATAFPGLDLLAAAVLLMKTDGRVVYANPAAENLFEISRRKFAGRTPRELFGECPALAAAIAKTVATGATYTEQELELGGNAKHRLHLTCTVSPVEARDAALLLEFRHIDQQLKIAREERLLEQQQANRELIRSLAHEIKNPLGGIRGAAQLLEHEFDVPHPSAPLPAQSTAQFSDQSTAQSTSQLSAPLAAPSTAQSTAPLTAPLTAQLTEYTQVIIGEVDRLQSLVDRLLTPHRLPTYRRTNVHELLVRVRSVVQSEFPRISIQSDFDISLPEFEADPEQLTQVFLNVVKNGAQAVSVATEIPEIRLVTRIARGVTFAKKRHKLALSLAIIDNGPGIAPELRDKIFYPLVSGREGGSGLGLTIAQTYVAQHEGTIEWESGPGRTVFTILLPLEMARGRASLENDRESKGRNARV